MPEKMGGFTPQEMNPYRDPDAEETVPTVEQDYSIKPPENPYWSDGDESKIGTTELTPELAEQIGENESMLQATLGELNENITAIDNEPSQEERRAKWDKIGEAFKSLKVKLNIAKAATLVAGMGTLTSAMVMHGEGVLALEQATNMANTTMAGTLGTIAILSMGSLYNRWKRKSQERNLSSI